MLLPNEGITLLLKHSSSIKNIFHFDFNEQNHFISLSDEGEIIEWFFNIETLQISQISKFHLKRPNNELLLEKKHKIQELKKGKYYKITEVIQFENYIVVGYSDGIILVYQVSKKQNTLKNKDTKENKSSKSNKIIMSDKKENEDEAGKEQNKEEKNSEENESEENEENEEKEEKEEKSLNLEEDKNGTEGDLNLGGDQGEEEPTGDDKNIKDKNEEINLEYYNYFSLYYVLLGHLQDISALCYIPEKKLLVSSSDDQTVKIFDFETGHLKYYFKLDFIVNKILYQSTGRNKDSPNIVLTLLSNDPVKAIINLSSNPITFAHYFFKFNSLIQLEKINDKYYGLNKNNIVILDKNLNLEGTFISLNSADFKYFYKYKNDYLIADNENNIKIVELINKKKEEPKNKNKKNEKKKPNKGKKDEKEEEEEKTFEKQIINDCKFKVGEDVINGFFVIDNIFFVYCQDGKIFSVNYDKIKENYERMQMAIEDIESLKLMLSLVNVKKSKKKGKSKKKDKKK